MRPSDDYEPFVPEACLFQTQNPQITVVGQIESGAAGSCNLICWEEKCVWTGVTEPRNRSKEVNFKVKVITECLVKGHELISFLFALLSEFLISDRNYVFSQRNNKPKKSGTFLCFCRLRCHCGVI